VTPSNTRFSAVIVPVLSKQQTSTRPANGMRKGSVQKIAGWKWVEKTSFEDSVENLPNLDSATSDALTASDNSMGNSGGTTLVMTRIQSSNNFDFFRFLSMPGYSQSSTNFWLGVTNLWSKHTNSQQWQKWAKNRGKGRTRGYLPRLVPLRIS